MHPYCTCLGTASVPLHQPLQSHLHLQPQPLLLQLCTGAQLPTEALALDTGLAQGAKGLFYLLWSLGWAAKQGFLNTVFPWFLLPCCATAPHLPNQEER